MAPATPPRISPRFGDAQNLTQRMRLLQRFRNRVAHHDCLLGHGIGDRADDMLLIAEWIDPDAATWLGERSRASEAGSGIAQRGTDGLHKTSVGRCRERSGSVYCGRSPKSLISAGRWVRSNSR